MVTHTPGSSQQGQDHLVLLWENHNSTWTEQTPEAGQSTLQEYCLCQHPGCGHAEFHIRTSVGQCIVGGVVSSLPGPRPATCSYLIYKVGVVLQYWGCDAQTCTLGDYCEHESNMQTLHVVDFVTFCQTRDLILFNFHVTRAAQLRCLYLKKLAIYFCSLIGNTPVNTVNSRKF